MTLYFIGLGLCDQKDISVKGLEAIKKCEYVYLEEYTSLLNCTISELEQFYEKKIILADRDLVESKAEETILENAKTKNTAFLVIGDPMVATTHSDLFLRARKASITVEIIHNASITSAIAETGLQIYKFGPVASIPFSDEKFKPETPYNIIKENIVRGNHTLLLLDLKPSEKKFMTVADGLKYLLEIENKCKEKIINEKTRVLGCARIGSKKSVIKFGKLVDVIKQDFGKPLHCIIIPGNLHFIEEEFLQQYSV